MDYQKLTVAELQKIRKNTISFKVLADVEAELKRRQKIKKTSLEKFQDLGLNVKTESKRKKTMKKSELKKIVKEEIKNLKEDEVTHRKFWIIRGNLMAAEAKLKEIIEISDKYKIFTAELPKVKQSLKIIQSIPE